MLEHPTVVMLPAMLPTGPNPLCWQGATRLIPCHHHSAESLPLPVTKAGGHARSLDVRRASVPETTMIGDRSASEDDRAVSGHRGGDTATGTSAHF